MQHNSSASMLLRITLACGLAFAACSVEANHEPKEQSKVDVERQFMNLPHLPKPEGYTHVVTASAGKTIYLSGQGGAGEDGKLPDDFTTQAENTFKNIEKCLEMAGATFNDVVKMNYYLVNVHDLAQVRDIRSRYINMETPPASTLVQTPLIGNLLIEIDVVAVVPE